MTSKFEIQETFEGLPVPKCWQRTEGAMASSVGRIILSGEPGIGKSYAALNFGLSEGEEVDRIVCHEEMTVAAIEGMFMPNEKGTYTYHEGPGTRAWRHGRRLLIDEVNRASGDVLSLLLAYTDTDASAKHILPTGERISPQPGFNVVMTTNLVDLTELDPALYDRFPVKIQITEPHPSALLQLPKNLQAIARELCSGSKENGKRVSLRGFLAYVQLMEVFEVAEAAEIAFGKGIAESIQDTLMIGSL
jgi:MoxR-like ATPase